MRMLLFVVAAVIACSLALPRSLAGDGPDTTDPEQFEVGLPFGSAVSQLAVTPGGNVVVGGWSGNANWPVTPDAVQTACTIDRFGNCSSPALAIFSSRAQLVYSTFLGGESGRSLRAFSPAADGTLMIVMTATAAPDPTFSCAPSQVVLARLRPGLPGYRDVRCVGNAAGAPLGVSALGTANDGAWWLVGQACSQSIVPVNAWQPTLRGGCDVFAARYEAGRTEPSVSTYIGGSDLEYPSAAAVAPDGDIVITGSSQSYDFPVVRAAQPHRAGTTDFIPDAFLVRLDAGGRRLEYSTYLGGSAQDYGTAVAVDGAGNAYVTGVTASADFPVTTGAEASTGYGAFVSGVEPAGGVRFSAVVPGFQSPKGVSPAEDGSALIAGETSSSAGLPQVGRPPEFLPGIPFYGFPCFARTDRNGCRLRRATFIPVRTGAVPQTGERLSNYVEAVAFDSRCVYVAGQTFSWTHSSPYQDWEAVQTGHYLKKWRFGPAERETRPRRD